MKKALLIGLTLLSISTAAQAQYFKVQANCHFNNRIGECSAYNGSNRPMYCRGKIYGHTYYGFTARGRQSGWVRPRGSFYMYVYAQNPGNDPLIETTGQIECRF